MLSKIAMSLLGVIALLGAPRQARQPAAPEPPDVSLCSLLSRPADYDGKEVRIRAQYNLGFEWSYFDDESCKEYAVKTTPYRTADVVWAKFDESVKSATGPEVYAKFREASAFCCPDGWRTKRTELAVVGRFFKAAGDEGYGHMGRYAFQILVKKVESVGETKLTSP
jgi:hypothetical protein